MDIQTLGALGEFIGSIAVLITLIFVVVQLKQNTVAVRSASRGASATAIAELDRDIARDPELAKIYLKSFEETESEYDELAWFRFVTAARSLIGLYEDQYIQSVEGTAPKEQGDIFIAAVAGLLELPAWRKYWESDTSQPIWRGAFVDAVNNRATPYQIHASTFAGGDYN